MESDLSGALVEIVCVCVCVMEHHVFAWLTIRWFESRSLVIQKCMPFRVIANAKGRDEEQIFGHAKVLARGKRTKC